MGTWWMRAFSAKSAHLSSRVSIFDRFGTVGEIQRSISERGKDVRTIEFTCRYSSKQRMRCLCRGLEKYRLCLPIWAGQGRASRFMLQ
jgi:hypothetical protein